MKTIYSFLLFSFPIILLAQTKSSDIPTPDARLIEAYGQDYITTLQKENPFLIKRWNFYLDNAFYITEEGTGKNESYQTIEIDDIDNINILKVEKEYKIERDWELPKAYKIGQTGKLLVYHPGKKFNQKLKAYLKKQ